MTSTAARRWFSYREYAELEAESPIKHEFLDGEVWAMAGGTPEHAALIANVIVQLGSALRGRSCRVFSADLRIRVKATGLSTYPDISVACGKAELDVEDPKGHAIVNPTVLVEVLSPTTERYDRGEKLSHYRQVDSLREVLLVSHDERCLTVWRREQRGWIEHVVKDGAAELTSLGVTLPLDEVYRDPLA